MAAWVDHTNDEVLNTSSCEYLGGAMCEGSEEIWRCSSRVGGKVFIQVHHLGRLLS